MKYLKRILCALIGTAVLTMSVGGCSVIAQPTEAVSSQPAPSEPVSQTPKKAYKIALVQFAEQPSLDTVREAFMTRLEEWGCDETQIEIDYQNAGGDSDKAESICKKLVEDETDLILAVSSPAAEAAVSAVKGSSTKVLFADADIQADGNSVTGISVSSSVTEVIDLALEADPELKKLGLLYNPDETISAAQIEQAKEYCSEKKIELVESTVSTADGDRTEEITAKVTELCANCDAVLTPMDSTVASVSGIVSAAMRAAEKPWYATELAMVERGALAAVSIDYTLLGYEAADMAVELMGGRELSQLPAVQLDSFQTYVNRETLKAVQTKLPDETIATANFVTDSAAQ